MNIHKAALTASIVVAGAALLFLAGCSNSDPQATPATTSASTSATAPSSAPKLTTTRDVYSALCARNCVALRTAAHLPTCTTNSECNTQVRQADAAIKAIRQDMIDSGLDRTDYIELDDALTKATVAIDDYEPLTCGDSSVCGIESLTVKLSTGTVVIVLGGGI